MTEMTPAEMAEALEDDLVEYWHQPDPTNTDDVIRAIAIHVGLGTWTAEEVAEINTRVEERVKALKGLID